MASPRTQRKIRINLFVGVGNIRLIIAAVIIVNNIIIIIIRIRQFRPMLMDTLKDESLNVQMMDRVEQSSSSPSSSPTPSLSSSPRAS